MSPVFPAPRPRFLTALAVLVPALALAASSDREGLVTIASPAPRLVVDPGTTAVRLTLEVAFGATVDGIPADPASFAAKLSGVPASVLNPLFADVVDEQGRVVGKRAQVDLPLNGRTRFAFTARVRGQGGRPSDNDRLVFVVRPNTAPVIDAVRVLGAIGTAPDGTPRVNPDVPVTVEATVHDAENDPITYYEVSFGDGTLAQRAAPGSVLRETHAFPAGASGYTIAVTVYDWASSSTATAHVRLNAPPVARLRLSPPQGTCRYPVFLDGLDSEDPDGEPLTYAWDFGNGTQRSASTDPIAQVVYPSVGSAQTYTVRLTVRDPSGLADTASAALPIGTQYGGETMLGFDTPKQDETLVIDDGLPVRIALDRSTSGAVVDPSTLIVRLNGVDVTSLFAVRTDPARGGMPVAFEATIPRARLRLTDGNVLATEGTSVPFRRPGGDTDRVHDSDKIGGVHVSTDAKPLAVLAVRPGEAFTGDAVTLDASGSSDAESPVRFTFDFGDGTPPIADTAAPTVTHAYAAEGLYRPTVSVSDGRWSVVAEAQLVVRSRPSGGTPRLEVDRPALDFGQVNVTSLYFYLFENEPEKLLRVRNAGSGLLHVDAVTTDGFPFTVLHGTALPDLAAGESEFVVVAVDRSADHRTIPPGPLTGTLHIATNGGSVDVPIVADGRAAVDPPDALIVPAFVGAPSSVVEFGPALDPVTVRWRSLANQGSLPVIVDGVSVTGDDAAFFPDPRLESDLTVAPRQTDRWGDGPTPHASKVAVTFDPGAVTETRRLTATLHLQWRYQATPGVWSRGPDVEVGLVGLASYVGLVRFDPDAAGIELERVAAGQTTTMSGSAAAGLSPAEVVASFVAGRRPVDVTLSVQPLFPPGHTAIALQRTTATLDPDHATAHFPLLFRPTAPGHYSALVTGTSTNPAQAPFSILVHGYAKGSTTIPVLGTGDTLWFVDEDSYARSQTGDTDSALVVGLDPDGTVVRRDDGLGDLGVQVDPFLAARSEVSVDQWADEPSDLVVAGRQLYAIDADVLPEHDASDPGLTARAIARLSGGGSTGTGAIVRNRAFLAGMRANGDADLDAGGSVEPLDMDVTPDQTMFFTDTTGSVPDGRTRLRWMRPLDAVQGMLAADVSSALTGIAGREVSDLRAAWRGGTRYRVWLLLDDGSLYGVDVDLGSSSPLGAPQRLAPSAIPTGSAVLDGAGNWYTAVGDATGRIAVYRESLDGGAVTRQRIGLAQLPFVDAPSGLVVDGQGVVLVRTAAGVLRFTPAGTGLLALDGYVLAGDTFFSDQLRGDVVDGIDLRTAEVPMTFDPIWIGR